MTNVSYSVELMGQAFIALVKNEADINVRPAGEKTNGSDSHSFMTAVFASVGIKENSNHSLPSSQFADRDSQQ
ncbi:MAG TPA: hypothetical protein VFA90_09500 [Terriglobales bacterium]|nr:hypothetical protein [Terriglobales bacterium]